MAPRSALRLLSPAGAPVAMPAVACPPSGAPRGASDSRSRNRSILVASTLRIVYAMVRYGDEASKRDTARVLRRIDRYRLLASVSLGLFDEAMIGAKFFAISSEVLKMHPTRRQELADEVMPLYITLSMVASSVVSKIVDRFDSFGQSTDNDDELVFYCVKALCVVASQIDAVCFRPAPATEYQRARLKENVWKVLFPFNELIKPICSILLSHMEFVASRPSGSRSQGLKHSIRTHATKLLAHCICSSSSNRFRVLDRLVRAELIDRRAVRGSFISSLLREVKTLASTPELHAYLASKGIFLGEPKCAPPAPEMDADGKASEAGSVRSSSSARVALLRSDNAAAARKAPKRGGGLFAICAGSRPAARRAEKSADIPAMSARKEDAAPKTSRRDLTEKEIHARNAGEVHIPDPPPRDMLQSNVSETQLWQRNRIGAERICMHCWVNACDHGSGDRKFARRLIVVTTEAYYMLRENVLGSGERGAPVLLWSQRYEHLRRAALGLQGYGIHLMQSRGRGKIQMLSLFLDSTAATVELFTRLRELSFAWAGIRSMLAPETDKLPKASFEYDMPANHAVRALLQRMNALPKDPADIGEFLLTRVVVVRKGNTRLHRFLFICRSRFCILKMDTRCWRFPRKFDLDREELLEQWDAYEERNSLSTTGMTATETLRVRAAYARERADAMKSWSDAANAAYHREVAQAASLLSVDTAPDGKKLLVHRMHDLAELSYSPQDPGMRIAFRKPGNAPDSKDLLVHDIDFLCDADRERWRATFSPYMSAMKRA